MYNIFYISLAFLLGALVAWYLVAERLRNKLNVNNLQLEESKNQNTLYNQKVIDLSQENLSIIKHITQIEAELKYKQIDLENFKESTLAVKKSLEKNQEILTQENAFLIKQVSQLEAELKHKHKDLEALKSSTEKNQETLSLQFKILAEKLLDEKSKKFTDQNKFNIESLLKPLGDKIEKFEKAILQTNQDSIERNASLKTEVKILSDISTQVNREAENLSRAIKGDTKMQGNWGEFILESILEKSGLQKDREYVVQATYKNEEGKQLRPDIIINLPDNKHLIIDAKVSLTNYEKSFNALTLEEQKEELQKHILSIKKHIKDLSQKEYQQLYQLKTLDFVLMFIPIESAFGLAIQYDSEIFTFAYEKNIIIVSPSTLLATLRTISNIWQNEYRNRYAYEIARQGGEMYNKFVSFIEDLKKIGVKLNQTQEVYTDAFKKLSDGNGNLIKRAERIKLLGIKASKHIDQESVLNGYIE